MFRGAEGETGPETRGTRPRGSGEQWEGEPGPPRPGCGLGQRGRGRQSQLSGPLAQDGG